MEEESNNSLFPDYSNWNEELTPYQPQQPSIYHIPTEPVQDLQGLAQAKERFLQFAS